MATPSERRREEEMRAEFPKLSKLFDNIDTKQTGKVSIAWRSIHPVSARDAGTVAPER
jgi:hypothetical protein